MAGEWLDGWIDGKTFKDNSIKVWKENAKLVKAGLWKREKLGSMRTSTLSVLPDIYNMYIFICYI